MSRHEDELAIRSLIQLSSDEDSEIRDWATFGLGQMIPTDTPEIRNALLARTSDSHQDTRCEALVGLARRKDTRVFEPLLGELTGDTVGLLALEAAEELADPRLAPALMALRDAWKGDTDKHVGRLHHALLSCLHPTSVSPH